MRSISSWILESSSSTNVGMADVWLGDRDYLQDESLRTPEKGKAGGVDCRYTSAEKTFTPSAMAGFYCAYTVQGLQFATLHLA